MIPIFIVLYALYHSISLYNDSLNQLDVASVATFENYNVNTLIRFAHFLIGGFTLGVTTLTFGFMWLYSNSSRFRNISSYLNSFAAIGILFLFFVYTKNSGITEVNFLILLALGYAFFRIKFKISDLFFWWLCILAMGLSIFVKEIYLICHFSQIWDIEIIWILVLCLLIGIFILFKKRFRIERVKKNLYAYRPLFFLPWLSVLSDEIYLIANQRGFDLLSPNKLYCIGIAMIVVATIFLHFRKKEVVQKSFINELYLFVFPVALSGFAAYAFYTPFIEQPIELFELANPANAMANTFLYHQIPFVDYLNSHALSELFFGFIYIIFNGYSGSVDFLLYNFIFNIIAYLISYFFFLRIFGKRPVVFLLVLLFPFLVILIPFKVSLALILLFLLYNLFTNYSFKKLLGVGLFCLFTCIWRFDLGLPCLIISVVFLLVYLIGHFSRKRLFDYLKGLGIIGGIVFTIAIYFYIQDTASFKANLTQAASYLSANQAHAFSQIISSNSRINFVHYLLFPLLSAVIFLATIYLKKTTSVPRRNFFIMFGILFFTLFYFLNFQRGLVLCQFNNV